jgi:hypothetical protein
VVVVALAAALAAAALPLAVPSGGGVGAMRWQIRGPSQQFHHPGGWGPWTCEFSADDSNEQAHEFIELNDQKVFNDLSCKAGIGGVVSNWSKGFSVFRTPASVKVFV